VNEATSPLNLLLLINSFLSVGLILNQNESKRDAATSQTQSSVSNPLETITWICLSLQLILLLIKLKVTDS
jgi:hypothetical protein